MIFPSSFIDPDAVDLFDDKIRRQQKNEVDDRLEKPQRGAALHEPLPDTDAVRVCVQNIADTVDRGVVKIEHLIEAPSSDNIP